MHDDLKQLSPGFKINERENSFSIIVDLKSYGHLSQVLCPREPDILLGAILTPGEKSETISRGTGYRIKGSNLMEIRLYYLRAKKL